MKKTYYIKEWLVSFLLVLLISSCGDVLEKSPLDQFDNATFWTSESNALLALTGVYRGNINAGTNVNPQDWWSYAGLIFLEFATDNAFDRRGINSPFHRLSDGTLTDNINTLSFYWERSYQRIARCNDFLENIDRVPIDEAKRERMKAEARFIRACQYFYMSQAWGSVPLVTTLMTKEEANTLTKTPKADIVNFVISELTEAVAALPRHVDMPGSERGRASKQAALAFLGRMQLADERFSDAVNTYKTIIDFGDNIIDPDYAELFVVAKEDSDEHIFSAQFLENVAEQGLFQHAWPAVAGGWHIFNPLGSIVEAYDFKDGTPFSYGDPRYEWQDVAKDRDPRLGYNILFNGESFNGRYITHPDSTTAPDQLGAGKQTTQTGYGIKKFMDEGHAADLRNYGGDLPVIRYAEVLLSYLEAKLEAGDPIDQALLDGTINLVRGRASVNMPPITETDPNALREILRKERRIETAFEGIRYWDLIRWRIAEDVLNADFFGAPFPGATKTRHKEGNPDPHSRWYVFSRNFRPQDYQWPIPQSETNINSNLK